MHGSSITSVYQKHERENKKHERENPIVSDVHSANCKNVSEDNNSILQL